MYKLSTYHGSLKQGSTHVGAAISNKAIDNLLGNSSALLGHVGELREAAHAGRERDDGEAVVGAELADEDLHGFLHMLQPLSLHAPTDIEHGDHIHSSSCCSF